MAVRNGLAAQYFYNADSYNTIADLGLFTQLLQMIDGEWSDSIHAICSHIHNRLNALGVCLSVFDRTYEEFIYVSYSLNSNEKFRKIGIDVNVDMAMDLLKEAYAKNAEIIEQRIFSSNELYAFMSGYFNKDGIKVNRVINELNLKAIAVFPVLNNNTKYKCIFHVLTDHDIEEDEHGLLNDYVPQLDIALEIVFFVRDLYLRATHDGLTRLLNHKQGESLLGHEIQRIGRNNRPLTVAMLDLDDFKKINDTYGHHIGDEVLRFVGNLLSESLRKSDIVCRYGGEEFLLALTDTDLNAGREVLRRIRQNIAGHVFAGNGSPFSVTASIGVAQYDARRFRSASDVVRIADEKLYRAKNNGKNRIEW